MTLQGWLNQQDEHCYWLASQSAIEMASEHVGLSRLMDGAIPLFTDGVFENLVSMTPWLVPMNDDIKTLPNCVLKEGVLLCSPVEMMGIATHLRSLLLAGLDGEVVLFRYYDPLVITPMLRAMSPLEHMAFMGNIEILVTLFDEEVHVIKGGIVEHFTTLLAPWWVIKPEHMQYSYRQQQHVVSLSRRLWSLVPKMMANLDNADASIKDALNRPQKQSIEAFEVDLWVISQLAIESHTSTHTLAKQLMLNTQEQQQLTQWVSVSSTLSLKEALD